MPLPALVTAGIITGGANLLGQGINAYAQGKMNRKTRLWNEKMYGMQRRDALADWTMQNAYNSPAAQMERLRAAGLNPNLVYGHGADAQGGIIRSTDVKGWNPQAPQFDLGSAMGQFTSTMVAHQQMQKMEQSMALTDAQIQAVIAKTLNTLQDTTNKKSTKDLIDSQVQKIGALINYYPKFMESQLSFQQAQTNKAIVDAQLSQANTQFRIAENERQELKTGMTLEQGAIKILQMRLEYAQSLKMNPKDLHIKDLLIQELQQRINKIQEDAKGSTEKARLLKSTPNWYEQQGIQTLKNVLSGGGFGSGGSKAPKKR